MNVVDTSEHTINAEFDAAEKDIGTEAPTDAPPETSPQEDAQKEAEILMATGVIATSLNLGLTMFSGVSVNKEVTQQAAESYAILITKYFQGGLFALLDRYKEELAATTATIMLIKAVTDAKAEQEEKDAEAAKQAETDKQKQSTPAPTTAGLGDLANG